MTQKKRVKCEFLTDGKCRSIVESGEGKTLREEYCKNELTDSCCYLCINQKSCEISCNYLDKPADVPREAISTGQKFTGEYLGGHPAFPKKKKVQLVLREQDLFVWAPFRELELSVPYRSMKRIENMTRDRITAFRVLALGVAGALWKKEQLYTVLTYRNKNTEHDLSLVFKLDQVEKAQPSIYQRMLNAKVKK